MWQNIFCRRYFDFYKFLIFSKAWNIAIFKVEQSAMNRQYQQRSFECGQNTQSTSISCALVLKSKYYFLTIVELLLWNIVIDEQSFFSFYKYWYKLCLPPVLNVWRQTIDIIFFHVFLKIWKGPNSILKKIGMNKYLRKDLDRKQPFLIKSLFQMNRWAKMNDPINIETKSICVFC